MVLTTPVSPKGTTEASLGNSLGHAQGTTHAEQPEALKVEPSCWLEKALQITPTHAHHAPV